MVVSCNYCCGAYAITRRNFDHPLFYPRKPSNPQTLKLIFRVS